jgi:hypothetical protein
MAPNEAGKTNQTNKYQVIHLGQNGFTFIEVKPETLNGALYVRLVPSIGPSAISLRLDKTEALELIAAIADVAQLEHVANACADMGVEPS